MEMAFLAEAFTESKSLAAAPLAAAPLAAVASSLTEPSVAVATVSPVAVMAPPFCWTSLAVISSPADCSVPAVWRTVPFSALSVALPAEVTAPESAMSLAEVSFASPPPVVVTDPAIEMSSAFSPVPLVVSATPLPVIAAAATWRSTLFSVTVFSPSTTTFPPAETATAPAPSTVAPASTVNEPGSARERSCVERIVAFSSTVREVFAPSATLKSMLLPMRPPAAALGSTPSSTLTVSAGSAETSEASTVVFLSPQRALLKIVTSSPPTVTWTAPSLSSARRLPLNVNSSMSSVVFKANSSRSTLSPVEIFLDLTIRIDSVGRFAESKYPLTSPSAAMTRREPASSPSEAVIATFVPASVSSNLPTVTSLAESSTTFFATRVEPESTMPLPSAVPVARMPMPPLSLSDGVSP